MFERLSDRLQAAFKNLSGQGRLTEKNVSAAMQEVRRALLEADVNYNVARDFVAKVQQDCLGEQVIRNVSPGEQATKVVNDRLTELLGGEPAPMHLDGKPAVVLLAGLHGSGKTTTAAKLAYQMKRSEGRNPLLVAVDVYRPAAVQQLQTLGRQIDVPVYAEDEAQDVSGIALRAKKRAQQEGYDTVIIDTAGRHQLDSDLIEELRDIHRKTAPQEVLLVADAALGQEAVSVAEHFDKALNIAGIILSKLDGDARGGAALSMREVTHKPIKYVGTGEKVSDLEPFYPDRMASRILGMGDVVSLVEKASEEYEEEEAERLEEKMRQNRFDFDDFLDQMRRLRRMGGLSSLMELLPGMGSLKDHAAVDESQLARTEGMIYSMTPEERSNPDMIHIPRRRRIARGSGVNVEDVSSLLKQFETMRKMMKTMNKRGGDMADLEQMMGMGGGAGGPQIPMPAGGGMPGLGGLGGSGKGGRTTSSKKARKKNRKKGRRKGRK